MPNLILKKTFKIKSFQVANQKAFSLHGASVTPQLVADINQALSSIRGAGTAGTIQFSINPKDRHYTAEMNHDYQKYNEEDAIVAILDVMEIMGWTFRFQYDSELSSERAGGSSFSTREMFIFHQS